MANSAQSIYKKLEMKDTRREKFCLWIKIVIGTGRQKAVFAQLLQPLNIEE